MPVVAELDSFAPRGCRRLFDTAYTALLIYSRSLQRLQLRLSIFHPAYQVLIFALEVPIGIIACVHALPITSAARRCISM